MTWDPTGALSTLARRVPAFDFPPPSGPIIFNFDQGLPAHETFPLDDLRRIAVEVLDRDGGWALEYITFLPGEGEGYVTRYPEMVRGHQGLRERIAEWIGATNRRPDLGPGNVVLTSGAVQAIALVAAAFAGPGDGVVVEAPTFPYAQRYLTMLGADVRAVPVDADGLDVDALERTLHALRADGVRPRLVYTIPTFHLPTGTCLPLDRRRRLLELAGEWDLCVVEDAIYADLRYDGEPLPSLLELDGDGRVIQVHAFSKLVAPGIRLGWAVGTEAAVDCLARVRTDLGVSQWLARIMERFLAEGRLVPHLARAVEVYRRRRDLTVDSVRRHLGDRARFVVPEGGFYLWVELLGDLDAERVRAAAVDRGVLCRPGEAFGGTGGPGGSRHLRIAFSHTRPADIERGIARLAEAVAACEAGGGAHA
ncbi:MAG TPA: PLP-dependent aminotransferase family protein [Acidimicrobiales bacterium]